MKDESIPLLSVLSVGHRVGRMLRNRSKVLGRWFYGVMATLLVTGFIAVFYLASTDKIGVLFEKPVEWVLWYLGFDGSESAPERLLAYLCAYLAVGVLYLLASTFPLSVLFLPFERRTKDSRPKLREYRQHKFDYYRQLSPEHAYFAGIDAQDGSPVYVTDQARLLHSQISGMTGSAKTEGSIVPALTHDIVWGCGTIIIDMKGDKSLLDRVAGIVTAAGREKDFLFLSLSLPELSNSYNPLIRGNASEIKDKIISANVWSEEYYKKVSERTTLVICKAFLALGRPITFKSLHETMSSIQALKALANDLKQAGIDDCITPVIDSLGRDKVKPLAGLLSDFANIIESDFAHLLSPDISEIDLLDCILNNKIVFIQLPTGRYSETAIRLARILIQDIKTVSNYIQAHIPESERHFFPIFIDESAALIFSGFIDLISKARSAKIAITFAHQSLGDLTQNGDFLSKQLFDNTNNRFVFRQSDPESVNTHSQMGGTVETEKMTHQIFDQAGTELNTGLGSSRVVETFRIDPNMLKDLPLGYCVFHQKDSSQIRYLQTDYIPIKGPADFLEQCRELRSQVPGNEPMKKLPLNNAPDWLQPYLEVMT